MQKLKPSAWIRLTIGALEDEFGIDRAFPVSMALLRAFEEVRAMEATPATGKAQEAA